MTRNFPDMLHHSLMFTALDIYFASFLARISDTTDPDVLLAAALVSNATGNKHVCLDLEEMAGQILIEGKDGHGIQCPPAVIWREKLIASPLVGNPGEELPLILDAKNRLYLYRYWRYETDLAQRLCQRMDSGLLNVHPQRLHDSLTRYFQPPAGVNAISYPRAVITACFKPLCIITGGPGTGKTTTVAKILLTLAEQDPDTDLRIHLAAPTGKSAARLGESIRGIVNSLDCAPRIRDAVSTRPKTLHRLLKPVSGTSSLFYYGHKNPLQADVVVVDEASMVDMAMMSKLLAAVSENTRLILVGDEHQLASVEAGSAFGDICTTGDNTEYSSGWNTIIQGAMENRLQQSHMEQYQNGKRFDCTVKLDLGFRFSEGPGIDTLSRAVEKGDDGKVKKIFAESHYPDICFERIVSTDYLYEILERNIITGYTGTLAAEDDGIALEKLNSFKLLCALRKGPFGVEGVNRFAEGVLARAGLINPAGEWYAGRPVLITKNDYRLNLFNGDVGIIRHAGDGKDFLACFPSEEGGVRYISPYRLPEHETAFAMTVHKSQGSEFKSVLLLLPDSDTVLLTRELLYTGISRARRYITVCGTDAILETTLKRIVKRNSGLKDAIWNQP
jgi:exodeoxyribonuclease V alpha subunit